MIQARDKLQKSESIYLIVELFLFVIRLNIDLLLVMRQMIGLLMVKKITIHDNNVDLFKQEVEKLSRKYYLKDTKEMLLSVRDHLTEI